MWHDERPDVLVILLRRRPTWEERKQVVDWLFDATASTGFERVYEDEIWTLEDVRRARDPWLRKAFRKAG